MTKPVTAIAVMMLVEVGLMGTAGPVLAYFPERKARRARKTLTQHLLSHTSGFSEVICHQSLERHEQQKFARLDALPMGPTEESIVWWGLRALYPETPAFEPGARTKHDNFNYIMLRNFVRRVSG